MNTKYQDLFPGRECYPATFYKPQPKRQRLNWKKVSAVVGSIALAFALVATYSFVSQVEYPEVVFASVESVDIQ